MVRAIVRTSPCLLPSVAPSPTSMPSMTRSIPTAASSPHGSGAAAPGRAWLALPLATFVVAASWRRL